MNAGLPASPRIRVLLAFGLVVAWLGGGLGALFLTSVSLAALTVAGTGKGILLVVLPAAIALASLGRAVLLLGLG